ncbi:MAG: Holliday junction ATP-dependent DNA helicase ruvA [uncultured bacterium]|nr:MAG: Holliday junction ATP-dependent DNA helicase ruvA [uncultured bacterium]
MMSLIRGTTIHRGADFVIVENNGIGYKILFPEKSVFDVSENANLFLHEVIRESERELFGFFSIEQLELFWKLITVSGVGPKIAQKLVLANPASKIRERIMSGDIQFLTSVPGIGNKIAQKIILELKGALVESPGASRVDQDALEALVNLGYSRKQAEDALSGIEASGTDELIRVALKNLGKK